MTRTILELVRRVQTSTDPEELRQLADALQLESAWEWAQKARERANNIERAQAEKVNA